MNRQPERLSDDDFEAAIDSLCLHIDARREGDEAKALAARRALRADRLATMRLMGRRGMERMSMAVEIARLRATLEYAEKVMDGALADYTTGKAHKIQLDLSAGIEGVRTVLEQTGASQPAAPEVAP